MKCEKCSIELDYNAGGPGSHFVINDKGEMVWCTLGGDYYALIFIQCNELAYCNYWPPKYDNICVKCQNENLLKPKEKQMKEFDFRPFEVNKQSQERFNVIATSPSGIEKVYYKEIIYRDAIKEIKELINYIDMPEWSFKITQVKFDNAWQWEDIKGGWFFKTYNIYNHAKSICIKNSDTQFRWLYDFDHKDRGEHDRWLNNCGFSLWSESKNETITNVYDCQKLAKVLMIEKILT